jgi:hypothetical protein
MPQRRIRITSMSWLKGWLTGGDDELGWDDVVARIAAAIAERRQFGRKGESVFPAQVHVTVYAPAARIEVLRGFLDEPELDRRVQSELANTCDCEPSALPVCAYAAAEADRFDVRIEDRAGTAAWEIEVSGGDQAGARLAVPAGKRELRFGRGEWHGGDGQIRNDLVVSHKDEFVSRRAGRLVRVGHAFEVEALDQGDFLIVHRAGETSVRPARSASGRAALRSGDEIELSSGTGRAVRLTFRRVSG